MDVPPSILIVDDEPDMQYVLERAMQGDGYRTRCARDAASCRRALAEEEPDVLVLDVVLPDANGLDLLEEIRKDREDLLIIVITGRGSERTGLEAINRGAYDYFAKPFDLDELSVVVRRAVEKRRLVRELVTLRAHVQEPVSFDGVIGSTGVLRDALQLAAKAANSDVPILICGRVGTGKELVARAIHSLSPRRDKPFIKLNCAAVPAGTIQAELFGSDDPTGARPPSPSGGRLQLAAGGTLFLPEVDSLPTPTQAELVRVLQEGTQSDGTAPSPSPAGVRIIAAVETDLGDAVAQGTFRDDLYYALSVVAISLPSLARRRTDIPLLTDYFLEKHGARDRHTPMALSAEAMKALMSHEWPGNVSELESCIRRALVVAEGQTIELSDLPPHVQACAGSSRIATEARSGTLNQILNQVERKLVVDALREAGGVQARAAERLGITERSMWHRVKKHDLKPRDYAGLPE